MTRVGKTLAGMALALAALAGVSIVRVTLPALSAVEGHADVTAIGYYRWGVTPDRIVFDLWKAGPEASAASVLGAFFDFAQEMKDRRFEEVLLAWRGDVRFRLDGDDFREIGVERDWQNPVYVVRTFPEKLRTPEGRPAFESWSGGLIGVLGAQMDDVNSFADAWFRKDVLESYRGY
ncbi:hypothetical protein LAZ40_03215 [Cereibacter sphaeroides]|uniref:hypothetical protein n=1 Tax=Cereibacter sphaeroides TaxID=1063 RepID=UPI001F403A2B|nr:hypothetical protein [Cereibacter sphaeroides]MCE6958065.1 hypothetical protein [Cereibacter sphaeroides]MCE6971324.1 hypothetical protein [Cereibacter sphaeroides]